MVYGLWFRVEDLGFRVRGSPMVPTADAAHAGLIAPEAPAIIVFISVAVFEIPDLVKRLSFRVWGLGFGV